MKKLVVLLMICFLMAVTANAALAGNGAVWTKSIAIGADVAVMVDISWGDVLVQVNKGAFTKASPCNPVVATSTITGRVPLYVGANVPVSIELSATSLKSKNSTLITRWHTKLDTANSTFGDWKKSGDVEVLGAFTTPICNKYIVEWEAVCGDICAQEAGHYDGLITCKVIDP